MILKFDPIQALHGIGLAGYYFFPFPFFFLLRSFPFPPSRPPPPLPSNRTNHNRKEVGQSFPLCLADGRTLRGAERFIQQHDTMDNGSVTPPPAPVQGGQGPSGADGATSAATTSPNSRTVPNRSSHVTDPSRKHGHDGQAPTAMDQGDGDSDSGSSRSGGSPSAPSRDRSVSMNTHSVPPPSKKQRSSDDETESATPRLPRASHSAAIVTADDKTAAVAAEDEDEEQSPPVPIDIGSDSPGLTEESFMSWLIEQKNMGVGAGRMLDALGVGVSEGTAVDDDELWEAMISMGIRLIQPAIPARQKLEHVNTLQDVVELLRVSKKVLVLAGAGISVSCGIPDFRSENGIYSVRYHLFTQQSCLIALTHSMPCCLQRLGEYNLPNPQCMFGMLPLVSCARDCHPLIQIVAAMQTLSSSDRTQSRSLRLQRSYSQSPLGSPLFLPEVTTS